LQLAKNLEQPQHRLVGLRGQRQGRGGQLLTGLQGEEVCAFLVGVGQDQVVGAGLQRSDQVLGEVLTGLHRGEVGTEVRRLRAEIAKIDTALSSLRTQASKFGSNLTTVQTRQDFTKNMINTLQTGADNLVLADTNQEGANLLALQTRQQLSSTALALSAQADQAVLRLF